MAIPTWVIVAVSLVLLIGFCSAREERLAEPDDRPNQEEMSQRQLRSDAEGEMMLQRPSRPDRFDSPEEVRKYLSNVKSFLAKSGTRYGKRFSPISGYNRQKPNNQRQDWYTFYNPMDNNYEAM